MPTGTALRDAREQLFAAAERILARSGADGLTSRSVTTEAGVAKGVLHRHFQDFDDFLAALTARTIARAEDVYGTLSTQAGMDRVVDHVAAALGTVLDPVALGVVALVLSRGELRSRLRSTSPTGVPVLAELTTVLSMHLATERDFGRIAPDADVDALALSLVGAGQLMFAGADDGAPDAESVIDVVSAILTGHG